MKDAGRILSKKKKKVFTVMYQSFVSTTLPPMGKGGDGRLVWGYDLLIVPAMLGKYLGCDFFQ